MFAAGPGTVVGVVVDPEELPPPPQAPKARVSPAAAAAARIRERFTPEPSAVGRLDLRGRGKRDPARAGRLEPAPYVLARVGRRSMNDDAVLRPRERRIRRLAEE